MFDDAYAGRRVLVTGHTGFKGSWLVLWLQALGARVTGIALPPDTDPNHWTLLGIDVDSHFVDVRDEKSLAAAISRADPEIVFHMAAQSLVRRSYREPVATWAVNVLGTANVLEACRGLKALKAVVVVTTDKCYENREWDRGYQETDPLGGHDPYSASKAGAELVAASYRRSFFAAQGAAGVATARAGNVIGGGDWSEDRLIPDLARAMRAGTPLEIRSPKATRPWQHVLECLSGYLLLGSRLAAGDRRAAEAFNFGPDGTGNRTVEETLDTLRSAWPGVRWQYVERDHPHEAKLLHLDSSRARETLGWRPVWSFEEAVAATARWYRAWIEKGEVTSRAQLAEYTGAAAQRGLAWARAARA